VTTEDKLPHVAQIIGVLLDELEELNWIIRISDFFTWWFVRDRRSEENEAPRINVSRSRSVFNSVPTGKQVRSFAEM
jgi:hypothetical protein